MAATVFAVRLCLLPILPQPKPIVPDEFSHLFLAQTLASGRLTNPTHPMWRHFETLFVSQRPTYASPYPPLQGGLLASGLMLAGNAWLGVLLSVAAMCTAIVWMLQAYVTRFWALYGGVLAGAGYAVAVGHWIATPTGEACRSAASQAGAPLVFWSATPDLSSKPPAVKRRSRANRILFPRKQPALRRISPLRAGCWLAGMALHPCARDTEPFRDQTFPLAGLLLWPLQCWLLAGTTGG